MKTILAGAALLLAGCSQNQQGTLTCPVPQSGAMQGSLPESPAQIALGGQRLCRGSENEIAELAAALRARHPGVSTGAIVNYMVTAYCPVINRRADLHAAAKAKALSGFASRADHIVAATRQAS